MGKVLPFESPVGSVDLRDGNADGDDDAEIGELSSAGAEQVTMQIRAMVERAWEYIAIAYQGRAHLALGYRTWDDYVDDRLGDLRLTVPREERVEAVAAMSNARMSVRAIAKVLGVGIGTVHRGLAGNAAAADTDDAPTIQGRDGKTYRRRVRGVPAQECSICGETHPESPEECPWDLFAQGLGPRPGTGLHTVDEPAEPGAPTQCEDPDTRSRASHEAVPAIPTVVEAVTRAVCIIDELDVLPQLVDHIESIGGSSDHSAHAPALTAGVRELIERLRFQFDALTSVLERLERFTDGVVAHPTRR